MLRKRGERQQLIGRGRGEALMIECADLPHAERYAALRRSRWELLAQAVNVRTGIGAWKRLVSVTGRAYADPGKLRGRGAAGMAGRSPQEKKALSYTKDRRNDHGENDKGSRKSIRRNKRAPNRADRHREHQVLATAVGPVAAEVAEDAEIKLQVKKSMWLTKRWRKWRDAPLADVVVGKLRRRAERGMVDAAEAEDRIDRICRRRK